MAQHFLYSAAARSLSLAQIFRLSDDEAYALLRSMRWESGEPVCAECGGVKVYEIATRRLFKCAACRRQFSLTSGTLFASYKRPLRDYLAAIFLFTNGAKGVSALQMGRDLDMSYKALSSFATSCAKPWGPMRRGRWTGSWKSTAAITAGTSAKPTSKPSGSTVDAPA